MFLFFYNFYNFIIQILSYNLKIINIKFLFIQIFIGDMLERNIVRQEICRKGEMLDRRDVRQEAC